MLCIIFNAYISCTWFWFTFHQSGRCDGYVLEGKELEFYQKMLAKKKSK